MGTPAIDYNALAKQSGAISSTPPPAPSGGAIDYNALAKQAGATSSTPAAAATPAPAPSIGGFVDNALSSAGNLAGNVYNAARHPLDTVGKLASTGAGLAKEYVPGFEALGRATGDSDAVTANDKANADALKKHLSDRYGSIDNFGHTLYTDPVGVLADLSAVAGGVSGLARGVGAVADVAKAGDVASTAGRVADAAKTVAHATDPVALATKAGGAVVDAARPLASKAINAIPRPGFTPQLDPAEASAVAYGHANDVQMPTSTQTGSKVAANAENIAQNLPLMSGVAKQARAAEQSTLASAGAKEVDALGAQPGTAAQVPTPLDAGENLQQAVLAKEKAHSVAADNSYDLFRSIESQPQFKANVQVGTKRVEAGLDESGAPTYKTVPDMQDVQLPVDYRALKAAVGPMLKDQLRSMPIAQAESSQGIATMRGIMGSDDFVPASVADRDLGAMKGILRDTSQATSAGQVRFAADKLSAAVDAAANRAGPDAVAALKAGRESTTAKYASQDLQSKLGFQNVGTGSVQTGEAVPMVSKLTQPGDRSISLLRQVAEAHPENIPDLAQSMVQGIMDKGTAEAGMASPKGQLAKWNAIGPETKSVLTGARTQNITDWLTLNKKLAENPNPSGSGSMLAMVKGIGLVLTQPHVGVPLLLGAKPLARLLFTPNGARSLILAAKLPAESGAIGAKLSSEILAAAGPGVKPVPATPAGVSTTAETLPTSKNGQPAVGSGTTGQGSAVPAAVPAGGAAGAGTPGGGGSSDTVVKVAGGAGNGYKGKYKFVEKSSLNASHDGVTFNTNPHYPLENQRDYTNQINQDKIVTGASRSAFDPAQMTSNGRDATQGPPVTDATGTVYAGNGRKMMLDRVYAGNPDGAAKYRAALAEAGPGYGLDAKDLEGIKQPVLVRQLHDSELATTKAKQNAIADFNVSPTAAVTGPERAISDSRRVSAGTLDDIAGRLEKAGATATLGDVLAGKSGGDVLAKLVDDGVLSKQERATFLESSGDKQGELTPAGKDRVSQLMVGRFFRDPKQLESMAPEVRNRIERITAPLAQVETVKGWNLTPDVKDALELIERARQVKATNLDDFLKQEALFSSVKYSDQAVTLAKAIKSGNSKELTAGARQYAGDAKFADSPSMFGDSPTQKEAFDAAFGPKDEAPVAKPLSKLGGVAVAEKPAATVTSDVAKTGRIAPSSVLARNHAVADIPENAGMRWKSSRSYYLPGGAENSGELEVGFPDFKPKDGAVGDVAHFQIDDEANRGKGNGQALYLRALKDGPLLMKPEGSQDFSADALRVREALLRNNLAHVTTADDGTQLLNLGPAPKDAAPAGDKSLGDLGGETKAVKAADAKPPMQYEVFHGSTSATPFEKFDPNMAGSATDEGLLGRGFYFSTDPNVTPKGRYSVSATVSLSNPLELTHKQWGANKLQAVNEALGTKNLNSSEITDELRKRGYDGVILDYSPVNYHHKEVMVMNPDQIRIKSFGAEPSKGLEATTSKSLSDLGGVKKAAAPTGPAEKSLSDLGGTPSATKAATVFFHGTSAPDFKSFSSKEAYLTDNPDEAGAFAKNPIIGGGRGASTPKVYKVAAAPGKTTNIDHLISDAMEDDGDIDEAIEAGLAQARKDGFRYATFHHPSSIDGGADDFLATVSLHPASDLKIKGKK